jgi:N-acetylmuramoyl-L-alanine amidase
LIGTRLPHRIREAANREPRRGGGHIEFVILHYTGMASAKAAEDWLCAPQSGVSCHYLVDEAGGIVQMVDERDRAWHAGVSWWRGEIDINSRSIGIEIHNPGHTLGYPAFPPAQIDAVTALCLDIMARHGLLANAVLAHSDIAPGRKIDPGERFPWRTLARRGVGAWVSPTPIRRDDPVGPAASDGEVTALLSGLGFGVEVRGPSDPALSSVVSAFQRHWRPVRVNGVADHSTVRTLERLAKAEARLTCRRLRPT